MTVFRLEDETYAGRTEVRLDVGEKCVRLSIIEEAVAVAKLTPLEAVAIGKSLIRHGEHVSAQQKEQK